MIYAEAHKIATEVMDQLRPFTNRIEIGGSIRREKPEVKDIEIVCQPHPWNTGMFMDGIAEVCAQWECIKGQVEEKSDVKYTQRKLPQGINLDLFMCTADNWGPIFLIRTGDWEFSKEFMFRMKRYGLQMVDGYVTRDGKMISVQEEINLFRLCGMPFIEPKDRNITTLKSFMSTT